jgi:acyl carrier protein
LKLDQVSTEDDFMKLGGQSVDMFRMLARLENDFDREIDFDAFFENPRLSVLRDVLIALQIATR